MSSELIYGTLVKNFMLSIFSKKKIPANKFDAGNNKFLRKEEIWEKAKEIGRIK